jgi:hypothetical protein
MKKHFYQIKIVTMKKSILNSITLNAMEELREQQSKWEKFKEVFQLQIILMIKILLLKLLVFVNK